MYPCPGCGNDRPGLHAACVICDWKPHETAEILNDEPKKNRSFGWALVCFGIGFGLWCGAIAWLFVVITFMGASPLCVLSGVWQLVTGMGFFVSGWLLTSDAAAARKPLWFSKCALALCFVLGFVVMVSLQFDGRGADTARFDPDSPLVACDADSPKVVSVEFANDDGKEDPMWSATISVDGKKPSQYTGWPFELAGKQARPVSAKWHNNPDWVEIQMDNGRVLKLTWDKNRETGARKAETVYYLAPKFDRIR